MLTRRSDLFHSVLLIAVSGLMSVGAIAGTGEEFPRFEEDVLPIFQSNCLACHGENVRQADLDLRQRDTALKGGESGPALVPGSASTSLLFEKISSGAMPLGKAKLDTPEIELIRDWIDAGALSVGEEPDRVPEQREARRLTTRDVLVPILSVRCVICHGRRKQEGGLDLRTRASLLKGGKSGAAVIPGQPDESLLIKRIVAEEMPPPKSYGGYGVRPVTTNELEKLRQWISQGAPEDPDEAWQEGSDPESLVKAEDRLFWSFRSPERPDVPQVESKNSVPTPIDAFLLEKLEAKGLGFSPSADRLALMRRAYFDLIGLPPAPEEIERYRHDPSSLAYEKMIDRLLASPRYGERWARHWLDAVGYADSEGKVDSDSFRHHAYRYRNYVIRSFNQDKPYDQFLLEQIAGDELFDYRAGQEKTPEQWDYLVATGFLRMAPDGTYSGAQNFVPERLDVVADTVEILSSAVMGLTLACARCHSHGIRSHFSA